MSDFTPWSGLLGGLLIGLSASLLLLGAGRVAGISGITAGVFAARARLERAWRAAFLIGLMGVGLIAALVAPSAVTASPRPLACWLALARGWAVAARAVTASAA
jgi:uncharacterized protein